MEPVSDEQWELIEPVIPKQRTGRPRSRNHEILDALLSVLSTNIRWEEMPPGFPPKMTVYDRFRVWLKESFFEALFERMKTLKPLTDKRLYYMDAIIKSAKKGRQDFTGQENKRQKISLVVEENGLPEALSLGSAGRNDRYAFGDIVDQIPKDAYLAADKGYDCKRLRRRLQHKELRPLIPRRQFGNNTARRIPKPQLYRSRWTIERCFAWLGKFRKHEIRYEYHWQNWKAFGNWTVQCSAFKKLPYESKIHPRLLI